MSAKEPFALLDDQWPLDGRRPAVVECRTTEEVGAAVLAVGELNHSSQARLAHELRIDQGPAKVVLGGKLEVHLIDECHANVALEATGVHAGIRGAVGHARSTDIAALACSARRTFPHAYSRAIGGGAAGGTLFGALVQCPRATEVALAP